MSTPSSSAIEYSLFDRVKLSFPIFYPRRDASVAPPGAADYRIEAAPAVALAARYYRAAGASGTVLYFHGNGEVVGDHDEIAPFYHEIGLDLFVVDYRGYGQSQGRPTFASLIDDAHPVARFFHSTVDAEGAKGARFVMGRSLGAQPALEIATRCSEGFRGLILESGATSLHRVLARFAEVIAPSITGEVVAAHNAKIAGNRLPTLMLHGERDDLIPLVHATDTVELMTEAEPKLVVIAGAGHNDILVRDPAKYFGAIREFVGRWGLP
ncbi:MAG: alpha/beta hydrolase [Polyangiaceae bacterium]|nr:alpha/beta hydrolase [Polyangiaceae bacterium]